MGPVTKLIISLIILLSLLATVQALDLCTPVGGGVCRTTENIPSVGPVAVQEFWTWANTQPEQTIVWEIWDDSVSVRQDPLNTVPIHETRDLAERGFPKVTLKYWSGGKWVGTPFDKTGNTTKRIVIRIKGNAALYTGFQYDTCPAYNALDAGLIHVDALELVPHTDGTCGGMFFDGGNSQKASVMLDDYLLLNKSTIVFGTKGDISTGCLRNPAGQAYGPADVERRITLTGDNATQAYAMKIIDDYSCTGNFGATYPYYGEARALTTLYWGVGSASIFIKNLDNARPVIFESSNMQTNTCGFSSTDFTCGGNLEIESYEIDFTGSVQSCGLRHLVSGDNADAGNFTDTCVSWNAHCDQSGSSPRARDVVCAVTWEEHPFSPAPPVPANDPPTATLTVEPASGEAPLDVVLTFDFDDPDGFDDLSHYRVFFGDGTVSGDIPISALAPMPYTYPVANTYDLAVTIYDTGGLVTNAFATVEVYEAPPAEEPPPEEPPPEEPPPEEPPPEEPPAEEPPPTGAPPATTLPPGEEDFWDIEFVKSFLGSEETPNFTNDDSVRIEITLINKLGGNENGLMDFYLVNVETERIFYTEEDRSVSAGIIDYTVDLEEAATVNYEAKVYIKPVTGEYEGNNSGAAYINVLEKEPVPTAVDELPLLLVALVGLVVVVLVKKRE